MEDQRFILDKIVSKRLPVVCLDALIITLLFSFVGHSQVPDIVNVPTEIVVQLLQDELFGEIISVADDGSSENLVAIPTNLNADATRELIVHGVCFVCGAQNCPHWIFERSANGYRLLLDVGVAQNVELQSVFTNGYRDIVARFHNSALDHTFAVFKFDGQSYQLIECGREFDLLEDRVDETGNALPLGEPRVSFFTCNPLE